MTEIVRKESFHSKGWHAIIAMLMVVGGSACFVLSCISAMLIMKKADLPQTDKTAPCPTRAGGIFLHKKSPRRKTAEAPGEKETDCTGNRQLNELERAAQNGTVFHPKHPGTCS